MPRLSLPPGVVEAKAKTSTKSLPKGVISLAFCPTGPGGGVDNSCSSKDGGGGSARDALVKERDEIMKQIVAARQAGKTPSARLKRERARLNKELLKADDTPTPKEAKYSSVAKSVKGVGLSEKEFVRSVFGEDADAKESLVKAVGLSDDLHEKLGNPDIYVKTMNYYGDTVTHVTVSSDKINLKRSLTKAADGTLSVSNSELYLSSDLQGAGIGGQLFSQQTNELSNAGFSRITTLAARADSPDAPQFGSVGYKVWPKLGYDGELSPSTQLYKDAVKAGFIDSSVKDLGHIQQIYSTAAGRAWWETNGASTDMSFDLKPGSNSMKILSRYQEAKAKLKSNG